MRRRQRPFDLGEIVEVECEVRTHMGVYEMAL